MITVNELNKQLWKQRPLPLALQSEKPIGGAYASGAVAQTNYPQNVMVIGNYATDASAKNEPKNHSENGAAICHDSRLNLYTNEVRK